MLRIICSLSPIGGIYKQMQELDNIALLHEYAERESEKAFAALVTRHIDRVYSVALRHTRSPHQAEEITQAVFVILAQKAKRLRKGVVLEGWLYQTARLTALTFLRSEVRRARREQEACMQNVLNENDSEVWAQIAPLLDAALAGLTETDRNAVVLRFFYDKSMGEIGTALGANEDAARMRINRAIGKLQKYFSKRGVNSTSEAITAAISANPIHVAPATLIKTTTAVALAKGAAASTSTLTLIKGALKVMAWTKAQTTIVIGAVAVLTVGTAVAIDYQISAEPSYGGKTVTEWLDNLTVYKEQPITARGFRVIYPTPEIMTNDLAYRALMKIGSKAVPTLVKCIEARADWPPQVGRAERTKLWLKWKWSQLRSSHSYHPNIAPEQFAAWQEARKSAAGFMLLALGTNENGGFIRYAETYAKAPKHQSIYGTAIYGAPVGVTSSIIIGAAKSALPDRRGEIINGILQGLQDTNAWCRVVSLECIIRFPEELGRWKERLVELAQDKNSMVQGEALLQLMMIAQSKEELKIMPAAEIHQVAEDVLANPNTSEDVRKTAEIVRSLSMRDLSDQGAE